MTPDRPILIAGGGGFIGGQLAARLARQGHEDVRVVDIRPPEEWQQTVERFEKVQADLREPAACRRATRGRRVVFDLASDMGGMGFVEAHRVECMLSVTIGANLVRASIDAGVDRFFFASSACVYNVSLQTTSAVRGLRESDAYPAQPEDGYGWEKLFTERLCQHAAAEYGLETRIARYHNVYGPCGTWTGGREKAPAAICRKVAEAVIGGTNEIEIWGDGGQIRSFTYVDDAVEGTLRLLASDVREPLNVGSDRLVSIDELVGIVEEIAGVTVRRRYLADAPLGVRGRNSDNTRIRALLGWEPSIDLRQGLEATYPWIYDQVLTRERSGAPVR